MQTYIFTEIALNNYKKKSNLLSIYRLFQFFSLSISFYPLYTTNFLFLLYYCYTNKSIFLTYERIKKTCKRIKDRKISEMTWKQNWTTSVRISRNFIWYDPKCQNLIGLAHMICFIAFTCIPFYPQFFPLSCANKQSQIIDAATQLVVFSITLLQGLYGLVTYWPKFTFMHNFFFFFL